MTTCLCFGRISCWVRLWRLTSSRRPRKPELLAYPNQMQHLAGPLSSGDQFTGPSLDGHRFLWYVVRQQCPNFARCPFFSSVLKSRSVFMSSLLEFWIRLIFLVFYSLSFFDEGDETSYKVFMNLCIYFFWILEED